MYKMYIVHHNIPDDCDSDYLKLKMKCVCYLFWDPTAKDREGREEGGESRHASGNCECCIFPEAEKDFRFILQ